MALPVIGIDLGTTFSVVSFVQGGEVKVVHNEQGNTITPSVVHFSPVRVMVGEEAVKARKEGEKRTVYNIKRIIGRKHDDPVIREHTYPFEVLRGPDGQAKIRLDSAEYTPEEISARILKYMRKIAATFIGREPQDAVITVPSNFNGQQREATKHAAEMAGLRVLQIVNEPTAAAIAFGFTSKDSKKSRLLVYDLGGGTFDVSLVDVEGEKVEVLATDGYSNLGGIDFDKELYNEAQARFKDMGVPSARLDWSLMEACELAKRGLSTQRTVNLTHPKYYSASFCLTYDTFLELCEYHLEKTIQLTEKMIAAKGIDESTIDAILLVGGSTRIRRVRELLQERFPRMRIRDDVEPDLAVSKGAALLAASLAHTMANNVSLRDVNPFSLRLVLGWNKTKVLIPKNTGLPFSSYQLCSNSQDNETSLFIEIVEGENEQASFNSPLAKVELKILPRPKGQNLVRVLLSMDVSGLLTVSATDQRTGEKVVTEVKNDRLKEAERRRLAMNLLD